MSAIDRDVASNMTPRFEVYKAVDGERDFQDMFVLPERRYYQTHTLGEFILMLGQYADQAREKWTHHSDGIDGHPESLHEIRKLAALAVRCMEQHGAPLRKTKLGTPLTGSFLAKLEDFLTEFSPTAFRPLGAVLEILGLRVPKSNEAPAV